MPPRTRRLVGCLAIVAFMAAYIWLATVIAGRLPENRAVQFAFSALAGVLWGVPLLPLISWIQRPR
jgi:hypothetical protein